jgi:hypothetical protein
VRHFYHQQAIPKYICDTDAPADNDCYNKDTLVVILCFHNLGKGKQGEFFDA